MGTIRTSDCERIDAELRRLCASASEIETRKDEYSEDFIVWLTVREELHSVRVTLEEYREGVWAQNILQAVSDLSRQADS